MPNIKYTEFVDERSGKLYYQRLADNAFIPLDPNNTDYQRMKAEAAKDATVIDTTHK